MTYSSDHWVLQPCHLTDPYVIALAYFEQSDYAIFVHHEDKRGYRSIVRLINNDRMITTLNRNYTSSERIGLALAMALVTEAYTRFVPIAQNAVLGNNAHFYDSESDTLLLGSSREPVILHGHVFGRGIPRQNYVENVPLDGPIPGLIFDLRGQSPQESGNERKVKWKPDEVIKVVHRIKTEIEYISNQYKIHGLTVITRNRPIEIYVIRCRKTDATSKMATNKQSEISLNIPNEQNTEQLLGRLADINFTAIMTSDSIETRSSIETILSVKKSISIDANHLLRKRCLGILSGCVATEIKSRLEQNIDVNNMTQDQYMSFKVHDSVENYSEVYERIKTLFRSVVISSLTNNGPILFSTHGSVIRSILYHLKFHSGFCWKVADCAFVKLIIQSDGRVTLNDSEGITMLKTNETTIPF